jgi:hypothetical protein
MLSHHDIDLSAMMFEQPEDAERLESCNPTGNGQNRLGATQ